MAGQETEMGKEPGRAAPASSRRFTSKQMGDACEMLVAAELTLGKREGSRVG